MTLFCRRVKAPLLLPLLSLLLFASAVPAEQAPAPALSLEWIMADPLTWVSRPPVDFYFADDGKSVYFTQDRVGQDGQDLSRIDLMSGETTVVADAERGRADQERGDLSADRRFKVWSSEGDLFFKDLQKNELRQLTRTREAETTPIFLLDGRIAFQRGEALFIRDLKTGLETQAADLQLNKDPLDKTEPDDYLSLQQPRLLDVVRERQERKKEADRRRRERQKIDGSLPFFLGEGFKILDQRLSPLGNSLLVTLEPKERGEGRGDKMPNFVSNDGYVEILEVRPKVGTGKDVSPTLTLLDLQKHERHDFDPKILSQITDDPLAELREAAEARKKSTPKGGVSITQAKGLGEAADATAKTAAETSAESATESATGNEPTTTEPTTTESAITPEPAAEKEKPVRPFEWGETRFSPDGTRAVVMLRSFDNKDRWLVAASLTEPRWQEIHHLRRRGWINWDFNELGFLPGGGSLYFLSEESGFSHLYLHDFKTGKNRRLTEGNFTVADPTVSPDGKYIYLTANPEHPGSYAIYRVPVAGGALEQMTRLDGISEYRLSLDGTSLLLRHSRTLAPPELYVQAAKAGAAARQVTRTTLDKFAAHSWVEPQIVAVPSSHGAGVPIYSRYYAPRNHDRRRGGDGKIPAVIFIHGAGYLQNAHHGWSVYAREFFFHTWLSEQGYAVLDMDYRGSAGYGADFREAIYRHMGEPEVQDLEDGLAYLVANHGVDPARVGLYGGSYGGFLTLMGLFKRPEVFPCGAALRPVTDWAHYNHGYTSNILNTPAIDPEAYERSSPIEFAQGLRGQLLMCAPMQDDNVFFQDTVRLAQKLIELEKNDWEVAIYPVEPHGFRRPSSWLDEYKRIYKLFEGCLAPDSSRD